MKKPDTLFAENQTVRAFEFDQQVAEVFPDMINRSVPGYAEITRGIGLLADKFLQNGDLGYDLGCSLGAALIAIRQQCADRPIQLIGIDNSEAMVERCQQHLNRFRSTSQTRIEQADILQYSFQPCALIVMNFTLQFLPLASRQILLNTLYQALRPGGALIISEKLSIPQTRLNNLLIELHHDFKRANGYSELEISQKRAALENVLIPESYTDHIQRFQNAGFTEATSWYQHLNFASFIALK